MKYFFLALSVALLIAACNKTPKNTANRENILRSKKWRISGGTIRVKKPNGKDTLLNYLNFLPDCYKDDYIFFDSMRHGTVYTGGTSCNPGDPVSHGFVWQLRNNETIADLYDGFNNIYTAGDTIQPYHFDTLQKTPYLILDSVVKLTDTTPTFYKSYYILDTIRELRFTSAALPPFDIFDADITNFSSSSFTLNFYYKDYYPDSTNMHAGMPLNLPPIYRADTMHYALIYTSF